MLSTRFATSIPRYRKANISNRKLMDTPLDASLTIHFHRGPSADFKMVNQKDHPVTVLQPANFQPPTGWEYSYDAYQVAALQSFHILKMTLLDEEGNDLDKNRIITLANHVFRWIDLNKGQELKLAIPLYEFYNLDKAGKYTLIIQYGRDKVDAYAKTWFKVD